MSGPATLADLRRSVQADIRRRQRGFVTPADDWPQMMVVQSPHGVEPAFLPNDAFATGRSKTILAEVLREAMVLHGVFRYALLINAHAVMDISEENLARVRNEQVRIEQLEGAREMLGLLVGDAETEEFWQAEIRRGPTMLRTLGPWEDLTANKDLTMSGRFTGLNEALRRVKT